MNCFQIEFDAAVMMIEIYVSNLHTNKTNTERRDASLEEAEWLGGRRSRMCVAAWPPTGVRANSPNNIFTKRRSACVAMLCRASGGSGRNERGTCAAVGTRPRPPRELGHPPTVSREEFGGPQPFVGSEDALILDPPPRWAGGRGW